jgi:Zn-dependent metalloprotease
LIQDNAIEVYGSKLAAHFKSDGTLIEVQSSCWRDIQVDRELAINPQQLQTLLLQRIEPVQGFSELRSRVEPQEGSFPLTNPPRLVVYPWQNAFRLAWLSYGYGAYNRDRRGEPTEFPNITYGQLVIDATTGEEILFAPTLKTAETGSGLAVTPLGGPYTTRTLNIERVGTTSTYRLQDTTHARDIVTYDAACSALYDSDSEIVTALVNGTLPVSEDTEGDKNWNRLPSATVSRTNGQQPEVDAHYFAQQQYEWYHALAGRHGWDDVLYPDPPVPPLTINVLAHCRIGSCSVNNAYENLMPSGGLSS